MTNADYFTFNVDNSMLLTGQTGTGKTHLVRKLINAIQATHTPEEARFALFDLKQVEFSDTNPHYLFFPVVKDPGVGLDKLDELADLSVSRASSDDKKSLLFVYIEECDMAAADQQRFDKAVMMINKNAKKANMKLVYSTSRPAPGVVSKNLIASFDLILSGQLASQADADHLGVPFRDGAKTEPYTFLVTQHGDIYDAQNQHYDMVDLSKVDTSFGGDNEPHDERLSELLGKAYMSEIDCRKALVPLSLVVPFSDFQPAPNEQYLAQFTKAYEAGSPPDLYVYEKDGTFIMSDDYSAYYAYKAVGASQAICTVIGDSAITDGVKYGPPFKMQLPTLEQQA